MLQLPTKIETAEFIPIYWKDDKVHDLESDSIKRVKVQFNPETLKVNFSNKTAGGDGAKASAIQFIGSSTTTLALQLWFDVTALNTSKPEKSQSL